MKKKKGFTLIEVIVVIVILAILMAVAVPSVMSYMNSANKAKYYAASRSVTQKVNVELSKLYAGDSDAKNYNFAVQTAMKSYNKSVTGETYVSAVIFKYVNGSNNSVWVTSPNNNNSTPINNGSLYINLGFWLALKVFGVMFSKTFFFYSCGLCFWGA